jgi:hypothetical protein
MKICTHCRRQRSREDFPKHRQAKDGLGSWCKTCKAEDKKRYRAKNLDSIRRKQSEYGKRRRQDPDFRMKASDRMRAWREKNVEKVREANILRYGISLADYKRMFVSQHGKCLACSRVIVDFGGGRKPERAHIDHDHRTGMVRGLLCMQCNMILGAVNDSTEVLANLIVYLCRASNDEEGG